jgi:hypothetical protein
LKDCKTFSEVLNDLEACEIKEIDAIEQKFFDPDTDEEILPVYIQSETSIKIAEWEEGKGIISEQTAKPAI